MQGGEEAFCCVRVKRSMAPVGGRMFWKSLLVGRMFWTSLLVKLKQSGGFLGRTRLVLERRGSGGGVLLFWSWQKVRPRENVRSR